MKYALFTDIPKNEWNAFVEKSADAWFYHRYEYLEDAARQGNTVIAFAALTDSNEVIGICPCYLNLDTRYTTFLPVRFFQRCVMFVLRRVKIKGPWDYKIISTGFSGPALVPSLGLKGRRKAFKDISGHLYELGRQYKADEIHVRFTEMTASNTGENRPPVNLLWKMGFYESLPLIPRACVIIDLQKELDKIRLDMDEDCRSEINRAIKEGCSVVIDPEMKTKRYHEIHTISWNRTMGHSHTLAHFTEMETLFGDHYHVLFARHSDRDVAGVLLHVYKDAVMYWGGCSLVEGQKVKANNFLLFEAVKWAKEQGFKSFCIGVFESYSGLNAKEYRVGQYKAQFSFRHLEALEGRRILSKKALHYDYLQRKKMLKIKN